MLYFIIELYKYVFGILGHKLQAAVPILQWDFLNLNKKTMAKNEDIYQFSLAKIKYVRELS